MAHYRSVARALALMRALLESPSRNGVRLTELAERCGLDKGTTSRLLDDLSAEWFVEQDAETGRFRLGTGLLEYGSAVLRRIDLRAEALPILTELAQQAHETVHLGMLAGTDAFYLEKVESPGALQMRSRVGDRMPLHSAGLGKAMLAYQPEDYVERVVAAGLPRRTPSTITDPAELRQELRRIRVRGYSFDLEENEEGIRCVGAPIHDHQHKVAAALSIAGPAFRLDDSRLQELARLALQAAERISRRMGRDPAALAGKTGKDADSQ
jgi:DNA-binding IclR family transcriptional regulator